MMKKLLRKEVLLVSGDEPIGNVLKKMIDKKVSSALAYNSADEITGILTERDILRKLATLELDISMKHDSPVRTVMTKNVQFVSINNVAKEIAALHKEKKLRHFPVLREAGNKHKDNLVGMITVTDVARHYLDSLE